MSFLQGYHDLQRVLSMPIKFKCPNPNCQKILNVKDHLAGKRAPCPACKQVLTIPAPVAAPARPPEVSLPETSTSTTAATTARAADAEELAASLLADEPTTAPVEQPTTVDFDCPYCEAALHLAAELAGKQSPCPECGRIIKVPRLVQQQKVDWRNTASDRPSGARVEAGPAPEGAWGSTTKSVVSKEALVEADALPSRRPPTTARQWVLRGIMAVSAAVLVVVGTLLVLSWFSGKRQEKMLEKALAGVKGKDAKVKGEAAAVVHLAAGSFHLRRNEKNCVRPDKGDAGAWNQFGAARNLLATGRAKNPECDALLIELALAQIDLGGDAAAIADRKRLSWPDAVKEVGQTLSAIRAPEARAEGLRQAARKLIARGQPELARDLARQLNEGPWPFAVVALEYLRAEKKEEAEKVLDEEVLPRLKPLVPAAEGLAAPPSPLTPDLVALLVVFGKDKDKKIVPEPSIFGKAQEKAREELERAIAVGQAAGRAWLGQPEEARKLANAIRLPLVRLEALVALAEAPGPEGDSKGFVEEAVGLSETTLAKQGLPGWLVIRLVQAGLKAGVAEERLLSLAQWLRKDDQPGQDDRRLAGWVQFLVFRGRLAKAGDKAEESLLEGVSKGTLANAQARVELPRHNALKDSDADRAVDGWDESLRPFGYAGVALGLQGGN
jgi:hypothetical protein